MVRNEMEEKSLPEAILFRPQVSPLEDSAPGQVGDRETLKAFHLNSNMAQLAFKLKVDSRSVRKTGGQARGENHCNNSDDAKGGSDLGIPGEVDGFRGITEK